MKKFVLFIKVLKNSRNSISNCNTKKIKLHDMETEKNITEILLKSFYKKKLLKDSSLNLRLYKNEIKETVKKTLKEKYGEYKLEII